MNNMILVIFLIAMSACNHTVYELAFASDRKNKIDICTTAAGSGHIENLTDTDVIEYNFTWTDDGAEIYYTSYGKSGRSVQRIAVADKSISTIIRDSTIQSVSDVSKDKRRLLISASDHQGKGELYLYDVATGVKTRLTQNEMYEAGAKFSPDEKVIVASIQTKAGDSVNHAGIAEIFEIRPENLAAKQLTTLGGFSALPDFSPDGRMVAFHMCDTGTCDVYVMRADGSELRNLTKGEDDNRWPRWSPDGKWIAFTKTIDKNADVYFVSRDGKVIRPVVTTEFRDEIAIFKPGLK